MGVITFQLIWYSVYRCRLNISSPNEYSKFSVRDELANNVEKFHYFLTSIAVSPSFIPAVYLKYDFHPELKVIFLLLCRPEFFQTGYFSSFLILERLIIDERGTKRIKIPFSLAQGLSVLAPLSTQTKWKLHEKSSFRLNVYILSKP